MGIRHIVGVSDMKLSQVIGDQIITHALGSCIGIAIHDPHAHVGGILHYMLPQSKLDQEKAAANPFMFGDTGIPSLFVSAYKMGARKENMRVIMAGGAGTRLWPLSSRDKPKHFLKLFGGKSLIELTVDKLRGQIPDDRILILTSIKYKAVAQETLPQIPPENFVYEPCLRDTASAIGLAATVLKTRCPRDESSG